MIVMDVRSAELTKYAANAMLATKISFMNEIANLAERMGADIEEVRLGIGSDPRIGYNFIYPGAGYGGSCFPKDVKALVHSAGEYRLRRAAARGGRGGQRARRSSVLFRKIRAHFEGDLKGKTVAIWGLAFKPNTDDMREAPSRVADGGAVGRRRHGAGLRPGGDGARRSASTATARTSRWRRAHEAALDGADALAIVTEWQEFRSPDFDLIRDALKQPVIFDGRNLYDPALVKSFGLRYHGIGRGEPLARLTP